MSQLGLAALVAAMVMGAVLSGRYIQRVEMEDRIIDCAKNELIIEVDGRKYFLLETRKYIPMRTDADAWRARK